MKRDLDLVREILLTVETSRGRDRFTLTSSLPHHPVADVAEHVRLLIDEACYLSARDTGLDDCRDWDEIRLT